MSSLSTIAFVVPHFGKLPNYFSLWLQSCRYNPTIDWLVFTDDRTAFDYPPNVRVTYCTFSDVIAKLQSPFDFPIIIERPYQLCEFKFTYGLAFEQELSGYDFWGFCDTDTIWGDLRKHLPESVLNTYTKISWRGHLTLFRNRSEINRRFMTEIEGVPFWRYALANPTGFPLAFDEREINYIFEQAGEPPYKELLFADLKIRSFNFQLLHFPSSESFKNQHQVFYWEEGQLWRVYVHEGKRYRENFAYIHFLKRPMQYTHGLNQASRFLIVPNRFEFAERIPDTQTIIKLTRQRVYWSYLFDRLTWNYVQRKRQYREALSRFRLKLAFLPIKPTSYQIQPVKLVEEVT